MIHFFFSFFFFLIISSPVPTKEKIILNSHSNRTNFNSDSSEFVLTTISKNQAKKAYRMCHGSNFSTCDQIGFYWFLEIKFGDSTKVYDDCSIPKIRPLSKWMSFKLKSDSTTSVSFKVDLKTLLSQEDYIKGVLQNSHFGNYTATVSYCDRDRLNNKSETEVFTSNKIYFTYQK
jgi:hypothetical protein